ncbi:MAG: hypothetical protein PHF11_06980 [Candidatus Omnitrophica bacterium]|nr:hypothetical protein [Candidatus Omnitrophota bacterium]
MTRKFNWEKKGLIFCAKYESEWSKTHSALPTPVLLSPERLRIFYATRDIEQKSRISYIDVDPVDPARVLYVHDKPVLDIGELGAFDDRGLTSSFVLGSGGEFHFYYNGYNIGSPARYRIAIGKAVSLDRCNTFRKAHQGPVMDRSIADPCGCATPFIIFEKGIFRMWYTSFYKWEWIKGEAEPFYRISYAESRDGLSWDPKAVCIDASGDEGGIVRPTVVKSDRYYMWYSVRKKTGYRDQFNATYRIGFAVSDDGLAWERRDSESGVAPSADGWDSEMTAYPFVLKMNEKLLMFYNGNGFGKSGFGYAESPI